jgi:hypothetical protein
MFIYVLYMVRNTTEIWDLASFTDTESKLGRLVPTGKLLTFKDITLHANGKYLLTNHRRSIVVAPPLRGLLDGFVQLADAEAPVILRYARKWGLLFLDRQGRPCTKQYQVLRVGAKDLPRSEPLEAWRYYSRRARAVLNIAAHLQQGRSGSAEDWTTFDAIDGRIGPETLREVDRRGLLGLYARFGWSDKPMATLEKYRQYLAWELQLWMELGRPESSTGGERIWLANGNRL